MKKANDNFLTNDVANLEAHINSLFHDYPELLEDEDLRRDCLDGETNIMAVLGRLVNIERDADSMAKAIAERAKDLASRKARMERGKEAMRVLMLRLMKAANLPKASLPEATVSVSKGRASVEIVDEAALPDEYVRIERVPDKKALAAALANDNVPGAVLREGNDTVTVRAA